MKMENLNKTQIVLLTLLTSFVTSIATGIVTVTLLAQAPPAVTRTINRVIEKTIQTVIPGEKKVTTVIKKIIVSEKDLLVEVVSNASKSMVAIYATDKNGNNVHLGLGTVVSKNNYIIADKEAIVGNRNNLLILKDGKSMNVKIVYENKNFVILKAVEPKTKDAKTPLSKTKNTNSTQKKADNKISLTPILLSDSNNIKLGQTIVAIGGLDGRTIYKGIVSRLEMKSITVDANNNKDKSSKIKKNKEILEYIVPNFKIDKSGVGGPMLDMNGNLVGVNIITSSGDVLSIPVNTITKAFSNIGSATQSTTTGGKIIGGEATTTTATASSTNLTNGK